MKMVVNSIEVGSGEHYHCEWQHEGVEQVGGQQAEKGRGLLMELCSESQCKEHQLEHQDAIGSRQARQT